MVTTLFGETERYRRLSRARPTLLGSLSLWEGTDHFVQIEVVAFSEVHKRFYFEDIKAFTLRPTRRGLGLHLLFGVLTAAGAAILLWLSASGQSPGGIFYWLPLAITAAFALGWLAHGALGPTCACHVVTPVQSASLGALSRARRARKVIDHLAQRARISQGGMEVSAGDSGSKSESVFVAAPSSPGGRQHDALLREPGEGQNGLDVGLSRLHPVISSAALLNAACLFSLLVWDSYALRAVQILLIVGLLVLAISCVATSRRRLGDTAFLFKWIGWGLFVINGLVFLSWYGYAVYVAGVARSRAPGGELNYVQSMLQVSPHTSRFWFWVVLIDGCFSMLVGLMGLLTMLFRARRGGNRT